MTEGEKSTISAIHISDSLTFPAEAVTETFGFLAMRGAGKSNAVVVMAEEMYRLELPWVAIDPKGDWWGIRSNLSGTAPGLPIPIFGGLHGDLPLEPEAGAFIADLIVRENLTCVLDVSEFASKAKQVRFLADFADRLYRLHGRAPQPRHIFAEEADEYIPQRVMADMARCVGAWEQIIKRGRQRGLGCSIVTQRSASINKDALSQVLTLVAMRTTSPHDRKAILGWVDYHSAGREIVDALPELPSGEAWVISPQWLGRTERVRFNRRSTFDSGDTPKIGGARPVATLADINLGTLNEELALIIERAAADDPKALKRRITELERELKRLADLPGSEPSVERVEVKVPFIPALAIEHVAHVLTTIKTVGGEVDRLQGIAQAALDQLRNYEPAPDVPEPVRRVIAPQSAPRPAVPRPESDDRLAKAEKAILSVLVQFPEGRTRRQVAMLAGYSGKSGGFGNALSSLRSRGYINRGEPMMATPEGVSAIGDDVEPLPTGKALLDYWLGRLGKAEKAVLTAAVGAWPYSLTRDEMATVTGYSASSGGFGNALSRLRTLELIDGRGEIFAEETIAREAQI